jgi:hypothetical protein
MLLRYTVSCEEFEEAYTSRFPKPSIASLFFALLLAIAAGIFGGILVYFVEPQDRGTASVFCYLSGILFLAAIWDYKYRTKSRLRQYTEKLRSTYERTYTREQTLEFDQEKWIHETLDGKYESPWTSLYSAVEHENTFVFWNKGYMGYLPNRALNAEQAAVFRQAAFGDGSDGVVCKLSLMEFAQTEIPPLWRRRPVVMAEAHAAGLLLFLWVMNTVVNSRESNPVIGRIVAAAVLFLTVTAQFWYEVFQYFVFIRKTDKGQWEAVFSDRGVYSRNSETASFVSWLAFPKYRESHAAFLLFVDGTHYHIVPKSCLSAEKRTGLRALLEKNVPVK